MKFRPLILTGLIGLAANLAGAIAHAAPQAITITPTSVSPVIAAGTTYNGAIQVINQGSTTYDYKVYTAPYHVNGESYTPDFTPLPTVTNITNWFTLSQASGHVNQSQTATVNYSIHVPAGTPAGGYYAVIFAETQVPKTAGNITLNERVGEIVYVQVAGDVKQSGKILTWQAHWLQQPPVTAALRLENDGGVHYSAALKVNVRDIFGNSKYELNTTKEILPQTIRRLPISWDKSPALGLFKITGNVTYLGAAHQLPTRWVLVASNKVRLIFAGLIVLIILILVIRSRRGKRRRRSTKAS